MKNTPDLSVSLDGECSPKLLLNLSMSFLPKLDTASYAAPIMFPIPLIKPCAKFVPELVVSTSNPLFALLANEEAVLLITPPIDDIPDPNNCIELAPSGEALNALALLAACPIPAAILGAEDPPI